MMMSHTLACVLFELIYLIWKSRCYILRGMLPILFLAFVGLVSKRIIRSDDTESSGKRINMK